MRFEIFKYLSGSILFLVISVMPGCRQQSAQVANGFEREVLPNGVVAIRYENLPGGESTVFTPDLKIGESDGAPEYVLGDVRGIDAASDGTIYILDHQTAELRAYDDNGTFLKTVASRGDGPGELSQANGILLVSDSVVWIQDYGKRKIIKMDLNGVEWPSGGIPVTSYGYIWNGTVDHSGRIWKPYSQPTLGQRSPRTDGLNTSVLQDYLIGHEPKKGTRDSVYIGQTNVRMFVTTLEGGGYRDTRIPYDPMSIIRIDPEGGFWRTDNREYRITRHNVHGDTVLVIDVGVDRIPVKEEDRQKYISAVVNRFPERRSSAESIAALMPENKPVIGDLVVDDAGRLWVRRVTQTDAPAHYDVFEHDGLFKGTVLLKPNPVSYLSIRVRDGRIYSLAADSLEELAVYRTTNKK